MSDSVHFRYQEPGRGVGGGIRPHPALAGLGRSRGAGFKNQWSRSSPLRFWVLAATIAFGSAACSGAGGQSPLENARRSPEELAEAALLALAASDSEGLDALRVTREEYEALLWPSLPDRAHVPFDFVWSLTGPRSRKARREAVSEYGGLPLSLVRVELGQKREEYEHFTLYQEARMTVRNTETGVEGLLPLMDVIVEMDGGWKFLNFGEDL